MGDGRNDSSDKNKMIHIRTPFVVTICSANEFHKIDYRLIIFKFIYLTVNSII